MVGPMQKSFADLEYAAKRKTTRRERFLAELERITPWSELLAALAPFYPKGGGRGRPPIGLERMLRMYIVQQSLGLSDEGIEDALYDSQAIRQFVGLDLGCESAPDATTLRPFAEAISALRGLKADIEQDVAGRAIWRIRVRVDKEALGLNANEVEARLRGGEIAIYARRYALHQGVFSLDPRTIAEGEMTLIIARLKETTEHAAD